jgi:hypothetical protein
MKPQKQQATMTALDFLARLANGDRTLPLLLQAVLLFLQEDIGHHRQRPEAQDGSRAQQLIVIQANFFLAIREEDLDVEAERRCGRAR